MSGTLYLLFGAVALLFGIGCGNVSILLLAQGTARQHEFAVRAAVGAHSGRIVRQLLTESMLLAAIGVVLGVLASYGILAGIKTVLPRFAFAPEVVIRSEQQHRCRRHDTAEEEHRKIVDPMTALRCE